MANRFSDALRKRRSKPSGDFRNPEADDGNASADAGGIDSGQGSDGEPIDPVAAIGGEGSGSAGSDGGNDPPRRKRGRPPGSGNKAGPQSSSYVKGGIETTLLSIHQMGAAFFSAPEWVLEEREAKALAAALAEVERHYKIPGLSPEHAAILGLVVVAGSIYAPRIIKTANRRKAKRSGSANSGSEIYNPSQDAASQNSETVIQPAGFPSATAFKPPFLN